MRKHYHLLGLVGLFLFLAGCAPAPSFTGIPNMLEPKGVVAREIAELGWWMIILGSLVFLAVTGVLLAAVFYNIRRNRDRDLEVDPNPSDPALWIWIGGIIGPAIILVIVLFLSTSAHAALLEQPQTSPTMVEIIGHQWFWEVRYPQEEIITANEIHIPLGEPVEIRLTSADVIHSFWVPELHGKMDLLPGKVNTILIQAEETGTYRGLCAEFCGLQHANMQLVAVVEESDSFAAWVERERQPAAEPTSDIARRGQELFLNSPCAGCHTIRGTPAAGQVGPDLTHIASRLTIGAGILRNNRPNLAAWIADPQMLKPGNLMPPSNLSAEDIQALLAYLESLD